MQVIDFKILKFGTFIRVCFCPLFIILLHVNSTFAQTANKISGAEKFPKIGLVLSGGGARGSAHVGVLKVLEEYHIPVDMIAATSFGAIIGGLYASGYSAADLEEILQSIDWKTTLSSQANRKNRSFRRKQDDKGFFTKFKVSLRNGRLKLPSGLVLPNNLRLTLKDLVRDYSNIKSFDELAIPFRAIAMDLETGAEFVMDSGDLGVAMIASMSIPALFPAVKNGDMLLVDGGIVNNIPVDVARNMGADIVIVVDVSGTMMNHEELDTFAAVLNQILTITTKRAAQAQLDKLTDKDILIVPDMDGVGVMDFDKAGDIIPRGVEAANKKLDKLKIYALSDDDWQAHLQTRKRTKSEPPIIDFVNIDNDSDVADEVIRAHLSIKPGHVLDTEKLSSEMMTIYGLELFDEVDYTVVQKEGQTGLDIHTKSSGGSKEFFRFNLSLQEDFNGETGFQIGTSFNDLAINNRGGEWKGILNVGNELRIFTEIYQPIDYSDRYYIFADAELKSFNRKIADGDGTFLSQVRISKTAFTVGAGLNFGNWATLRAGLEYSFGKIRGRVGFPEGLKIPFDETALKVSFLVDTLDSLTFARSGTLFEFSYINKLALFGSDHRGNQIKIRGYSPFSWGDNTLGFAYRYSASFGDDLSELNYHALGGFLNLSAYSPNQIVGKHGGLASIIYHRKIAGGLGYLTQMPLYIGGSFETGNLWQQSSQISLNDLRWSTSLFVGVDTLIGPTYFGGALGSEGQGSVFLILGQIF